MKIKVFSCTSPLKLQFHHHHPIHSALPPSQHVSAAAAAAAAARRRRGVSTARVLFSVKAGRTNQQAGGGPPKELEVPSDGNGLFKEKEEKGWGVVVVAGTIAAAAAMAMMMGATADAAWGGSSGGPEGPLVEEFWDNVRRYGLYVLTVSTGAIYTILLPIVELLRTPVTAILIIAVLAGGFYLVSMVLSAMFGISEFAYDYSGY